jgi:hypothetical protein
MPIAITALKTLILAIILADGRDNLLRRYVGFKATHVHGQNSSGMALRGRQNIGIASLRMRPFIILSRNRGAQPKNFAYDPMIFEGKSRWVPPAARRLCSFNRFRNGRVTSKILNHAA